MQIEIQKIKTALLVFFLVTVFGVSASIFAEENSLGNDNIFLDSDQDGLSDTEEETYGTDPENQDTDGDGYSDGAEIKSGYNPLKPAPGDKITEDNEESAIDLDYNPSGENMTEELSASLAAVVSSGEVTPENISLADLDSIVDENVTGEIGIEELPEINKDEIKIKDQSYPKLSEEKRKQKIKEDEEEYSSTILYIMSNNLPHNISEEDGIRSFSREISRKISGVFSSDGIEYFEDLADKGSEILSQMSEVEVPESMLDDHMEATKIAKYAISLKDTVKLDMNDPIGSLVSLSGVESFMVMVSDFIEKLESYELSEDSDLSTTDSNEKIEENLSEEDNNSKKEDLEEDLSEEDMDDEEE